ncbi:hypothetical protein RvY_15310 [Ramazzottius varieornatus]|uniref:Transposase IS30-like HTH domain-containing protein n=1 Tax=Ramazzottius varieornatus TaxID=947166 RepID=A0A1D1W1B8_RAMVA|nr:hypothetical protein RvY_15310 [Ramazzottius varieornatus]
MGSETSSETKAMVVALHGQRLSYKQISEQLLSLGTHIHYKTIGRLIRKEGTDGIGWAKSAKRLPPQNLPSVRTKNTIRKVERAILKKRPDSQRQLARKLGCSRSTVAKIINQDLGLDARKKKKLHHLTDAQKKQSSLVSSEHKKNR